MGQVFSGDPVTKTDLFVREIAMGSHGDEEVPWINKDAAWGTRTGVPQFLTADAMPLEPFSLSLGMRPAAEQTLIHGDQSFWVTGKQSNWIQKTRDTMIGTPDTIGLETERYVNCTNHQHRVNGTFYEKHDQTTVGEYVISTDLTYFGPFKAKELSGNTTLGWVSDIKIRAGYEIKAVVGVSASLYGPIRSTVVLGLDSKIAATDWGLAAIKISTQMMDSKISMAEAKVDVVEGKISAASLEAAVGKMKPYGLLGRAGVLCLKAAASCLGTVRL